VSAYARCKRSRRIARRWAETQRQNALKARALEAERRLRGWPTPQSAWEVFAERLSRPDASFKLFGDVISQEGHVVYPPDNTLASLVGQVIDDTVFLSGFAANNGRAHGGLIYAPNALVNPPMNTYWFAVPRVRLRVGRRVILAFRPRSFAILDNKTSLQYFPETWQGLIYVEPEVLVS
jgi:hypothetical protein